MKQLHLPALGPLPLWATQEGLHWMDASAGPAYLPNALVSYWVWRKEPFLLSMLGSPETKPSPYLVGDSGGYSVVSEGAKIDPRSVITWQIKSRCNVGFILDIPPYDMGSGGGGNSIGMSGEAANLWKEALSRTARNVALARPYYESQRKIHATPFRWWGVLQGQSRAQMEQWYKAVTDEYLFDDDGEGWAFKIQPLNDPVAVARALGFLQGKTKRVHLLGGVGLPAIVALFIFARRAGMELATYDSRSSIARANRRAIVVPTAGGLDFDERVENFRDRGEVAARAYMRDQCNCWSCQQYRKDAGTGWAEETVVARMMFHNHLITLEILERLWHLSQMDGDALLRGKLPKQFSEALRAFDGRDDHASSTPRGTPRSILEGL